MSPFHRNKSESNFFSALFPFSCGGRRLMSSLANPIYICQITYGTSEHITIHIRGIRICIRPTYFHAAIALSWMLMMINENESIGYVLLRCYCRLRSLFRPKHNTPKTSTTKIDLKFVSLVIDLLKAAPKILLNW